MYRNVLMTFCRRSMKLSAQEAASLLGMPLSLYEDLESGKVLLDYAQAQKLAKLYNSHPQYFLEAAQQLDLLLGNKLIIELLKADNDRLKTSYRSTPSPSEYSGDGIAQNAPSTPPGCNDCHSSSASPDTPPHPGYPSSAGPPAPLKSS